MFWRLKRAWWRRRDLPWEFLANHVPKRLVYWCLIRAGAHASMARYSSCIVREITMLEMIERWHNDMEGVEGERSIHAARIPTRP